MSRSSRISALGFSSDANRALDQLAPGYLLRVAGQEIGPEITRFITKVEYESADGIADMVTIECNNPDRVFSDRKVWQGGNEVDLAFGYGGVTHVGSAVLVRPRWQFPQNAMPTVSVKGYTRDFEMMRNAPEEGKKRVFKDAKLSEILDRVASDYGFELDPANFEHVFGRAVVQKAGMSDYEFVVALANFLGLVFWVDAPNPLEWTLHAIDPGEKGDKLNVQDKTYTFRYDAGNFTTLLDFEPEYALTESITKLRLKYRDPKSGKLIEEEIDEDADAPDVKSEGKADEPPIADPHTTGGAIKIFFGNYSISTIANKTFQSAAEARLWALAWFRRNRENFIEGRGTTIGVESLRARQTHNLSGLGASLDGAYYFSRVRHTFDATSNGYTCDFHARKVIP